MTKESVARRKPVADQDRTLNDQSKPDRSSTRCISAHLPEDMYWQLKELAASERVEMQTIVAYAANALFEKKGKREIPIIPNSVKAKGFSARSHKP